MLAIILIIVAISLAGVGGFFAKDAIKQIAEADKKTGGMENLNEKEIFSSSTPTPTPIKTTKTYVNDNPKFSVEVKNDLIEKKSTDRNGYTSILFESPDYKMDEPENGYPTVKSGYTVSVYAESANSNVQGEFDNKPIYKEAGQNIKNIKVDNRDALQFDFGYEGVISVTTMVVKDELLYTIDMRYSYEEGKDKYFGEYTKIIESFKFL